MNIKRIRMFVAAIVLLIIIGSLGGLRIGGVGDAKTRFIRDFGLDIGKGSLRFEELFNNYEGFPYEGIALYKITLDSESQKEVLRWNNLPLSENAELFLVSISGYVELPETSNGCWMFVDRKPEAHKYTNISMCVYDIAEEVAYLITMDS